MKACLIFTGKELKEHARSYRLLIFGIVFVFFGILSPATARYMQDILNLMGSDTGVTITLQPATVLDSYAQFFKNMSGVGVILLLLVFAGSVAGEKARGSAPLILTKNLSRTSFLLAKYMGAAVLWTAAYALGALVCLAYTLWLFPGETAGNLLLSFGMFWLYGLLLLAFTTLASAAAGSNGMAALGAFAGWGLLMVSMIPVKIAMFSPAALGAYNVQVIAGQTAAGDMLLPALLAVGLIALSLGLASWVLSKQEL